MSKWQRLRLPKREGLPPLLYNYSGTSKGYEIYITDLTLLWSEKLSNRQIRKRADEDDTTIDPSEDSEQFRVLLQKIEEALRSNPGSSMALTSGANTDSLELHLTTKLPAPLRPLKWNIYLSKEPLTAATNHLLLPLLREEKDRELRQRTLLDQLKQKDWVLGKLFDKIEAMGIELSTIFPGISGLRGARKQTSLAQAAKYIRGVAPFDEQAWLDETNKSSPESRLTSAILREVSGPDSASDQEKVHPPPDGWWESLDIHSTAVVSPEPEERNETSEPEPKATKDADQMDVDTASEDDDDEFEVCIKPRLHPSNMIIKNCFLQYSVKRDLRNPNSNNLPEKNLNSRRNPNQNHQSHPFHSRKKPNKNPPKGLGKSAAQRKNQSHLAPNLSQSPNAKNHIHNRHQQDHHPQILKSHPHDPPDQSKHHQPRPQIDQQTQMPLRIKTSVVSQPHYPNHHPLNPK